MPSLWSWTVWGGEDRQRHGIDAMKNSDVLADGNLHDIE
jgi:hypothetical protein